MIIRTERIALALAIALAVLAYFHFRPQPAPVGVQIEAKPAPDVAKVEKEVVPCSSVQVYKPAAKDRLKLPASVKDAPQQRVVAATRTANDERQHTITTVLNTDSGAFTTYDRVEPLPWLAVNTKSQVGAFYGYKDGQPAIRFEAQQELLQVKAVHIGAMASADMMADGVDSFIGVGAWARW